MAITDLIRLFAQHRNAANLLMAVMIVLGVVSLLRLNTQMFPDFGIDVVSVTVDWPGASASDVEGNIVEAIEPEVRFLDAVDKVTSYAVEGVATIVVEFTQGADMQKALSEVESAVARLTTLPEDSERPTVRRAVRYDTISRLSLSGPFSEAALKAIGKRMREDLLAAGIDRVELVGDRDEEIWVEVPADVLRRLDLTLADIAGRIDDQSVDLPSGNIRANTAMQIRSLGLEEQAAGIGGIEIRSLQNGQKIYLRDVAGVREAFDDDGPQGLVDGETAIELHIQRAVTADALETAGRVQRYLDAVLPSLPPTLKVQHYDVQVSLIQDRINVLLKNGIGGLVLVVLILFVFLDLRVAFWVAAGIPVALLATLAVMLASGQSINMISLFALIMTLGIIVDDAIVVAEHAAVRRTAGAEPLAAAQGGALRMLAPVVASSLTTVAAFLPLLVIGDIIGTIIRAIPLVAIAVLLASLIECFLILPGHLRGAFRGRERPPSRFRLAFNRRFEQFRDGRFRRFVQLCVDWRYVTVAAALGALLLSLGLLAGGRVIFNFFPSPESDVVSANVVMAPGTTRADTRAMLAELQRAARAAEAELSPDAPLLHATFGTVGRSEGREFARLSGDRYGGLYVELVPSDWRDVRTPEFIRAWRAAIVAVPGVVRISLNERAGGPPGRELDIRLSGGSAQSLKLAALELRDLLDRFAGVSDVEDDLPYGKQEVVLEVTPRGQALGFSTASIGRQVRNAFEGAIAKRFPRGDEEVTVKVQYPRDAVTAEGLWNLYLRSPSGVEVPLREVVSLRQDRGFDRIRREDGRREVALTGELDETKISLNELIPGLLRAGLPELAARHGISYRFAGKAEEQAKTLADMRFGGQVGLVAIYIILAWVFASYSRPVVVMSIIPFGVIGVVVGHALFGYDMTILSIVGLIGLSGIVVNDSIILVSTVDERIARGEPALEAIVAGSQDRLRAVLLTSLTTIGGLTPLLFETSLQAQFLIPMALTIVSGLAAATVLVLIVVPAFMAIQADVGNLRRRWRASAQPAAGD